MTMTQPFLPLSGDAAQAVVDRARLRGSRNDAAREENRDECRRIVGKRLKVFVAICEAGEHGLTMREMAAIGQRSINCWCQPFTDLRNWGVIETTEFRRNGGVVHRLKRQITVESNGEWE